MLQYANSIQPTEFSLDITTPFICIYNIRGRYANLLFSVLSVPVSYTHLDVYKRQG